MEDELPCKLSNFHKQLENQKIKNEIAVFRHWPLGTVVLSSERREEMQALAVQAAAQGGGCRWS